MWTYRKCMPYHLAIHKVVADVAPHQSPRRYEFHAQQSIYRGTVSMKRKTNKHWYGSQSRKGLIAWLTVHPRGTQQSSQGRPQRGWFPIWSSAPKPFFGDPSLGHRARLWTARASVNGCACRAGSLSRRRVREEFSEAT